MTITASVPDTAPYLDKAVLNLTSVHGEWHALARACRVWTWRPTSATSSAPELPNATDASLVDQVGSGAGTGFSAFKDLDPVIIGGPESGLFVNAKDASLINEAASGQTDPADSVCAGWRHR